MKVQPEEIRNPESEIRNLLMDFNNLRVFHVNQHIMDPKQILSADLLDIVFEDRNKEYGAYDLRRGYRTRLTTALLTMIVLAGLILGAIALRPPGENEIIVKHTGDELYLTQVEELPTLPELTPPPPAQTPPPATQVQERMFTSTVNIRPDHTALNSLPSQAAMSTALPSDKTTTGVPPGDLPRFPSLARPSTVKVIASPSEPQAAFIPDEIEAGFPGGADALREFMTSNLVTPGDLAPGDKKTVHIRFNIDPEGKVSSFEIVQSAGYEYDQEVLRVCKKMPKWKPARQNGVYVAASFMLPVSFVGE